MSLLTKLLYDLTSKKRTNLCEYMHVQQKLRPTELSSPYCTVNLRQKQNFQIKLVQFCEENVNSREQS